MLLLLRINDVFKNRDFIVMPDITCSTSSVVVHACMQSEESHRDVNPLANILHFNIFRNVYFVIFSIHCPLPPQMY